MKLRKRLLLLPLLGILMLLLCGCENDDAVSIYIDELPENANVTVQLCDREGQWHDAADADDIMTRYVVFSEHQSGWGAFEETYDCDVRLSIESNKAELQDSIRMVCETYPECRLLLTDADGGILQTSDTVSLILPDKFACAMRIIYDAADNTVQTDRILPRKFWGRTVIEWLILFFCIAVCAIPVLLILFLCCDVQKHRRGILTAAALLNVPGVLFCVLYFLQKCLPYLNLYDTPLKPADFLCLLAVLPNAAMLLLLIRKQRHESMNTNGVSL